MELKSKSKEKISKVMFFILVGLLLLVIAIPTNKKKNVIANHGEESNCGEESYYEERLKRVLEYSYGKDTMEVMVSVKKKSEGSYLSGDIEDNSYVDGVLVVASVKSDKDILDITNAVCALFDLEAYKVAVIKR